MVVCRISKRCKLWHEMYNTEDRVVVLDIEHWPLTGSPDSVRYNLTKYMTVLEWFRAAAPGVLIGTMGRRLYATMGARSDDT